MKIGVNKLFFCLAFLLIYNISDANESVNENVKEYLSVLRKLLIDSPIAREVCDSAVVIAYIDQINIDTGSGISPRSGLVVPGIVSPLQRSLKFYTDSSSRLTFKKIEDFTSPALPLTVIDPSTGKILFDDLSYSNLQKRGIDIRCIYYSALLNFNFNDIFLRDTLNKSTYWGNRNWRRIF